MRTLLMLFLISSSLIAGSWDGFYLSGLAGSGWCQTDGEFTGPNYFNTLGPSVVGTSFDFNKQGFLYGGALGWNYQKFCFVAGIEGSALGSTVKETRSSPFFPTLDTYEQHLKWMAALKLRVGLSLCGTLAYATGGYAGGATRLAFYDAISEMWWDSDEARLAGFATEEGKAAGADAAAHAERFHFMAEEKVLIG